MGSSSPVAPKGKKAKLFDAADYLDSVEAIAAYLSEALPTRERDTIEHAIRVALKARARLAAK
jgi:DNA-binding phage protein